jgi:hypothetical protein
MKFIITEDQQDRLSAYDKAQKMFFRYWDKNGPKVDDLFFKLFGFTNFGLEIGGNVLRRGNIYRMLRNWYGGENAKLKAIEMLKEKNFTINSCGGYNFDFEVVHYKIEKDTGEIYITAKPDIENGTVELIMVGGETESLKAALDNPDYGWEIEGEIADCIHELLHKKITETTGHEIGVEKLIVD